MGRSKGHQKGPQQHAEGQHGRRTHAAFIEGLHGRHGGSEESEGAPQDHGPESGESMEGHRRLFEDRQQHDEAEKNSEANRLAIEKQRAGEPVNGPSLKGHVKH